MRKPELDISTDKHRLDVALIHAFLHDHAPWAKGIPRATVEQAIAGSLCFGAYLDGRQVGFARVVTDLATFGYLCDVFVVPECRGRGYARQLMQCVAAEPALARLRRIVLVTSNAHPVYRPFGFAALEHPERYMELHRPDVYQG
ncbi:MULTISPECIES: GNAT family N-acetyltransferase [Chromobacterium]|uniref:N-acetyltransferase n=1 Tax=Chromobacterium haemolyticum TaxID=394935 RepID=A0A1W0CTY0_9NEIS|nr:MULTISPECIES: GNAT family N-acetyltransferase [Chromobacterium]MBK0414312.1 GNAT family N-acetyltransferase [Chromobacterium haemolyticum]MBO0415691.1 GNAT family N-acetyltransferase [Chromobacterium haemolyticum]MBO0498793.1 GNAT family N-acetyltransferase [Chromobacterium haemolyticum]OQS38234.1 N-acetyltransferase [Chromobacterium haemolyticum]QOZ84152.1 N-acetyltransferase [Chromobacterium sp. Rain0013]